MTKFEKPAGCTHWTPESSQWLAVASRFDSLGRRVERRVGADSAVYQYDAFGALIDLQLASGGANHRINFTRDALGREVGRTCEAFRLDQRFDDVGRISRQRVCEAGNAPQSGLERIFTWATMSKPACIEDNVWGKTSYAYDGCGQVIEARYGDGLPPPLPDAAAGVAGLPGDSVEIERFTRDAAGDTVASDLAAPGDPSDRPQIAWLVSQGGKVKAARNRRGEKIFLAYDAQSRVVIRRVERNGFRPKTWHFRWNALDRMTHCVTPQGDTWSYLYDPFGRRVEKVLQRGHGEVPAAENQAEVYVWDGQVVTQVARRHADGRIAWADAVTWHHQPGTYRPLARTERQTVYHVVSDHLGTPRDLYGSDGRSVWSGASRLGGERRALPRRPIENTEGGTTDDRGAGNDDLCPIGYPGQWMDRETGLAYNHFRYFDPETIQYLSDDPLGLVGGLRPTGYVRCPISESDPTGLSIKYQGKTLKPELQDSLNDTLSQINEGAVGQPFQNAAGDLPVYDSDGNEILYQEYPVENPYSSAADDNTYRVVTGSDGSVYFTGTHYGQNPGTGIPFTRIR